VFKWRGRQSLHPWRTSNEMQLWHKAKHINFENLSSKPALINKTQSICDLRLPLALNDFFAQGCKSSEIVFKFCNLFPICPLSWLRCQRPTLKLSHEETQRYLQWHSVFCFVERFISSVIVMFDVQPLLDFAFWLNQSPLKPHHCGWPWEINNWANCTSGKILHRPSLAWWNPETPLPRKSVTDTSMNRVRKIQRSC